MNILKKTLVMLSILMFSIIKCFAEDSAGPMSTQLSFYIGPFMRIAPITSPILTANITDRTGNLYAPLATRFRVITNATEKQTLYLQAHTVTDGGYENSMFQQGGQIYIAFANLSRIPSSQALANCKLGGIPKDSPGVVAYPITSITGASNKYIPNKGKYEVYVDNGTTDVTVNVGANVLPSSFAANDPRGFYQAVLSLTEADI